MPEIRLDKKNKTIKVVNRKDNITLRHDKESIRVQRIGKPGPTGQDGESVDLRNNGEAIQYKYTDDTAWTDLVSLEDITGPRGDSGTDVTYAQPFTNSSAITVLHNLNKYPAVTVVDTAGDEVRGDVHYDSSNQVTVTFSSATGGTVYCN